MANDVKIVLTAQDKASEGVNRVAGRIEALEKASSAVAQRMDTIRNALAGVVTVGAGLALSKQFIDMADSMALLQSRVKLATSGAAEFAQVQTDLFALAQRNSVSLEEVSGAFSRLSDPVKRLGGGSKEAIGIIESLSKSLKISGASAQESAAAIQQFGQAMGSGKLQGDEFKSLAEAAPRFMKAISEGSGIAAEKLKEMSSEGKLTADVVGNALLNSLGKLNAEAAQMPDTVGQSMTRLKNEIAKAVDEINQSAGIGNSLSGLIGDSASLIAPIKTEMIEAFQSVGGWIERNREGLAETGQALKGVAGDVWRIVEAFSSVLGFVVEVESKSGVWKTSLESVRLIIAGIEDGITIIGAAFAKVGADITDVLYKPLGNVMLAYGNFLERLGSSSAEWWQQTGEQIRATTDATHQYADGVYQAFANGESAVGKLNAELEKNEQQNKRNAELAGLIAKGQADMGREAARVGVTYDKQGKAIEGVANAHKKLQSTLKDDDKKAKGSGADPYQQLLESMRKRLGTAEQVNEVEKLNVELQEKKYAKITPLQKANLQAIAAEIDAQKRWQAEGKATVDMIEDTAKAQAKAQRDMAEAVKRSQHELDTFGMSRGDAAERDLQATNDQIAAERALADEMGVASTEILRQLEARAAAQQKILGNERGMERKQAAVDAAKAAEDAAKAAAAEWQKTVDRIDETFHDAFSDMIKSGKADWESFTDSLATTFKTAVADEIYKLTLKPLVVNVVGSFAGGQSVPGADGQPISLSNGFGMLSGAQAAWNGINGGIANAANSFAMSGFGQAAGLSTTAAMGPPTAAGVMGGPATVMTAAGSTFAAAAGPVLGALAATYAIAEMQKSGWGSENNAKGYATDLLLRGGLGTSVITDRLFGHNRNISNDAQGITGTFDASGFSGQTFQDKSQKGGTFSKDKRWTDYGAIGADMDKALDSMLKQAVAGVQTIGKTLGVEAGNAMEGFSHTFALQLSENGDMSKAGEKIAAELKKVQDELATRLVPNIEDFARYGESASDTFARLNQEVTATDAILLAMGKDASTAFGAVGLASIKAREDLIDLAGGLDKLASKTQFYYANFFSGDEQMQRASEHAQKVLGTGFAELGLSIPATREAFRALVESQDLTTEGGRKLFNSLLDLSDEFDTVADASDAAATKLKEATTTAQQGQASLFDTFATDAQKLSAAQKLVNDTFVGLGKTVPATAGDFLKLTQAIDPASEAGQSFIKTMDKVAGAFSYVQTSAASAATAITQARATQRSVVDSYDPSGAVARAQADIAAAFAKYGAAAPTDQAGVAAVANGLDANTEIGRQQLAELNALTGAFNTVFSAQAQAASSQRSLQDSFDPTGAVARARVDIAAAFGKYGATAPTDQAGLAAVARSIDTTSALGREQMATLQSLSDKFETVFSAQAAAAQKMADAAKTAFDSRRSLQDGFDPAGAVARAKEDIAAAFGKYGATSLIPTTRAGVSAVAGNIDVSTELGREQMAALQSLSGAFETVFSAQERAAQAAADVAKAAADEQIRLATQVHDSISNALRSLLGQSEQFENQSRQMAQATLQSALVIAKAGGSLSNFQGLDAALASVNKLDKATFATAAGYAVEFGRTANLLTQLEQYTRINGSHANGLDYVPFDGYVAQLHKGERVQTAASAAAADATVAEVKALRSDLNVIGAALATNTQRTTRLLEKFDVEGIYTRV